ncbi:NAD(P)H-binding protein [Agromyces intestinalis]|uniref:NAD(P)H-binding protein n=1 Tax=Agromyces intestinalis TaxID=2592652 RepID=A0A5C1YCV4_9MICO|nr:NAD(P)H-binding protein [Agromyces intestinalis]QEO13836.1 NAD(P)H-binding protein [Agromyces intestinalis]
MRIVVVGATGTIGRGIVPALVDAGHEAVAASRATGVDAFTGAGLVEAVSGADAVVDVLRPASDQVAGDEVREFFARSTENLLAAERSAGVAHHVALSVVGCDRVPESGFLHAKFAQEQVIRASGRPFTIVRATQFFEFVAHIVDTLAIDGAVRVPPGRQQPMAAADVAAAVARISQGDPVDGTIEIAGPEAFAMVDLVRRVQAWRRDLRPVVADPAARYFGTTLTGPELLPGPDAQLSSTTFDAWLAEHPPG